MCLLNNQEADAIHLAPVSFASTATGDEADDKQCQTAEADDAFPSQQHGEDPLLSASMHKVCIALGWNELLTAQQP